VMASGDSGTICRYVVITISANREAVMCSQPSPIACSSLLARRQPANHPRPWFELGSAPISTQSPGRFKVPSRIGPSPKRGTPPDLLSATYLFEPTVHISVMHPLARCQEAESLGAVTGRRAPACRPSFILGGQIAPDQSLRALSDLSPDFGNANHGPRRTTPLPGQIGESK